MANPIIRQKTQGVIKIALRRAGGDIILLYRLSEEQATDGPEGFRKAYSLTVTKVDCGGERREVRRLYDITRSYAEAERIFNLVSRGLVTPCSLYEVVCELISI